MPGIASAEDGFPGGGEGLEVRGGEGFGSVREKRGYAVKIEEACGFGCSVMAKSGSEATQTWKSAQHT